MVVAHNQQLTRVSELRGKSVAMADALAVVSMQGVQILRDAKLEPGRDVFVVNLSNHSAAINYVIAGELPVAIVSDRALMQLPQKVRDKVKIVQTWERHALPGVVYLVNPGLPREQREQLSKIILEYTQHNPEGLALMKRFGYDGLKSISPDEMRTLAPYGLMLKEAMSLPLK